MRQFSVQALPILATVHSSFEDSSERASTIAQKPPSALLHVSISEMKSTQAIVLAWAKSNNLALNSDMARSNSQGICSASTRTDGIVSSSTVHLSETNVQGSYAVKALGRKTMLKTLAVALLAIAVPVALAQAHGMGHHMHRHMIPGCAMGQPAAATCACGAAANHRPLLCHKGQWCHPSQACTM
jgi:hypothetical protein